VEADNMKKTILVLASVLILIGTEAKGQFMEDGLRLSNSNGLISSRASIFSSAFAGLADDFSALYYNPAGLALIRNNEIAFGFGIINNSIDTDYQGQMSSFNSNASYISDFGVVSNIPSTRKNMSFALGYFQEGNYSRKTEFGSQDNFTSYIKWAADNGSLSEFEDNMAYHLWLADSALNTQIAGGLNQEVFIIESGGLHNISGGIGFDISDKIALGFGLHAKFGSYEYSRELTETDSRNNYSTAPYDISSFMVEDYFTQDITGMSASVGLMIKAGKTGRIGITLKTPSYYSINEVFGQYAEAEFDDGFVPNAYDPYDQKVSYTVTTPFVYIVGGSYHLAGLTLSAGIEYSDATQIKFSSSQRGIDQINKDIARELTGQFLWAVGAEYKIPEIPVFVRAGVNQKSSAYQNNPIDANVTMISGGAGVLIAENIMLNLAVRYTNFSERYWNYADYYYSFEQTPINISLGINYRY
jgi:hypothetical protein